MQVTHVVIKNNQAKGFNRNIFIRNYGNSGAVDIFTDSETVTVTFRDGKVRQFDRKRGILLRNL